jgi:hypothetical protein
MCKQWGRGKGRGGGWKGGGREGRLLTNIYQRKPLKYEDKEGMFFFELETNY